MFNFEKFLKGRAIAAFFFLCIPALLQTGLMATDILNLKAVLGMEVMHDRAAKQKSLSPQSTY